MSDNILEYKGYCTKIEYSVDDKVLYGKIEGIKDLVSFESSSTDEIEKEFQLAVDDYLNYCADLGQSPDKAYSGSFNIRITPELHKQLYFDSIKNNCSINKSVEKAIEHYFSTNDTREKVDFVYNAIANAQNYSTANCEPDYYPDYYMMGGYAYAQI